MPTDRRQHGQTSADGAETRERIDGYLTRSGLASPIAARRAADRRRLGSAVLPRARSPTAVDRAVAQRRAVRRSTRCRSSTSRGCSRRCRCRFPQLLGHADDLGVLALAGSRRRHAAGAPRRRDARRARGALPPGGGADRDAAAARRGARVAGVPAVRRRVRRREADLGARLLHQALHRGVPRRRDRRRRRARRCGASSPSSIETLAGRAARAVPPRLSQPQPDAARRRSSTSSTSRTRAWGPTPTISCRCCATRTSICRSRPSAS